MKKTLIVLFTILLAFVGNAQKKGGHNFEKIKSLKISYITEELNLTPEVAEQFWPVYNQYEKESHKLRSLGVKNIKEEIKKTGSIEELSDKKATELAKEFVNISEKHAANKRAYFKELGSILTPQQLLQLQFAEIEFNYKVLRKLNKERKSANK